MSQEHPEYLTCQDYDTSPGPLKVTWDSDVLLADFHIHSCYSRATSKAMRPVEINSAAKRKGIHIIGTGDFTHPEYLEELEETLEPDGTGLYVCKDDPEGTRFILTAEVSNIFTQGGRSRRIHTVLFAPDFEVVKDIQRRLDAVGNIRSDGRPIFGFPVKELVRMVMEASPDCMVIPAHIWTPWFSLFGAKSGFDTLEECFEEQSSHIHALETGLSSDPEMNWRLSCLDSYTLISNSDAHSPAKIAREANVFSCEPTYKNLTNAIKKNGEGFEGTIEFFPEEGKYHFDGHRACSICLKPSETIKLEGICPVCGRPLTVGVAHRVEELADRPEGFIPEQAKPSLHIVPLEVIIAQAFGVKSITARVVKEYNRITDMAGTEMEILMWKSPDELRKVISERVFQGIMAMRKGKIRIFPGFDGEYGKVNLFETKTPQATKQESGKTNSNKGRQLELF